MKKILIFLLTIIMSLGTCVLVGCGDGDKETLYVYSFRVEDDDFYTWMNEKFEKENNCNVEYVAVDTTSYPSTLTAKLTAHDVDVFFSEAPYLYDEGLYQYMQPMNDLSFLSNIKDSAIDQCKTGDDWLIAPLNYVTYVCFYNKTIFNKYSLSVPTTYDEFIDVLDTLDSKPSSEITSPILYCGRDSWPLAMIADSIEYPVVRKVNPDYYLNVWRDRTQAFNQTNGLYQEYFSKLKEISTYFQENCTGYGYNTKSKEFAKGKYGITIDGSWAYKDIIGAIDGSFEIGTFILPASDIAANNDTAVGKMGAGLSICKYTEKEELAKKYIEFHLSTEVYQKYLDEIQMDSIIKGMQTTNQAVKDMYNKDTVLSFENYKIPGFKFELTTTYGTALVQGSKTVKEALDILEQDNQDSKVFWTDKKIYDTWIAKNGGNKS